jgi:hypothetical protein
MAILFMRQLPKDVEFIMRDDVVRIFTLWQAEVNGIMHRLESEKKVWFESRLKAEGAKKDS